MPLDPLLVNARPLQLPDPMEGFNSMLSGVLNIEKLAGARREEMDRNALNESFAKFTKGGVVDRSGLYQNLAETNQGHAIPDAMKKYGEIDKLGAETGKTTAEMRLKKAENLLKKTEYRKEAWKKVNYNDPYIGGSQALQLIDMDKNDPDIIEYLRENGADPDQLYQTTKADLLKSLQDGTFGKRGGFIERSVLGLENIAKQKTMEINRGDRIDVVQVPENTLGTAAPKTVGSYAMGIDPNSLMMEGGRNARNAADNYTSRANNADSNATSRANTTDNIFSREGIAKNALSYRITADEAKDTRKQRENYAKAVEVLKKVLPPEWHDRLNIDIRPDGETYGGRGAKNSWHHARNGGLGLDFGKAMFKGKLPPPDVLAKVDAVMRQLGAPEIKTDPHGTGPHNHYAGPIADPARVFPEYFRNEQLVVGSDNKYVKKAEGVEARRNVTVPDFTRVGIAMTKAAHKDDMIPMSAAQVAAENKRNAVLAENEWRRNNNMPANPNVGEEPDDDELLQKAAQLYEYMQKKRARDAKTGRDERSNQ